MIPTSVTLGKWNPLAIIGAHQDVDLPGSKLRQHLPVVILAPGVSVSHPAHLAFGKSLRWVLHPFGANPGEPDARVQRMGTLAGNRGGVSANVAAISCACR